jgi:hypothetical protein
MVGECKTYQKSRSGYRISVGGIEIPITFRLENNIKMSFKEVGWKLVDQFLWLRIGSTEGIL